VAIKFLLCVTKEIYGRACDEQESSAFLFAFMDMEVIEYWM